jgi:hypothetical protein
VSGEKKFGCVVAVEMPLLYWWLSQHEGVTVTGNILERGLSWFVILAAWSWKINIPLCVGVAIYQWLRKMHDEWIKE